MKLIYVCWLDGATADLPLFSAQAWERRGHKVHLFPYDLEFANRAPASVLDSLALHDFPLRELVIGRRLDQVCERLRPDALLFAYPFVSPGTMQFLRGRHHVRLGFSLGYNNLLEPRIAESISLSDFVLVHDSYMLPILKGRRNGRCPHVFNFTAAANPQEHRPLALSEWDLARYGGDVAFIGGFSGNRAAALMALTRFGLRIWGYPAWDAAPVLLPFCSTEPVYGLKKTKIYNACKIVISIDDEEKNIHSLSCRVPEVLACGGFPICQWTRDLDDAGLKDSESLATFKDHRELAEKVEHYLARPDERRRISENGRAYVLKNMTYDAAYGPILDNVEASLRGDNVGI